jgi:hypothetical protein
VREWCPELREHVGSVSLHFVGMNTNMREGMMLAEKDHKEAPIMYETVKEMILD